VEFSAVTKRNVVGIATGCLLDGRGDGVRVPTVAGSFSSPRRLDQFVPGTLFSVVKRPAREADHSPPTNNRGQEYVDLYMHYPIRFHGVVLN
jgi:hypothetical protein